MLVSKDATIREIHHRVKNNLQTIAALLRLQGRHLQSPEARAALEESERRIRAIAVVHETLSRDPRDVVLFDDIVRPLVRVVQETVSSPDTDLRFEVDGDAGYLPGDLATPLAVVLNELMQNAVDHAFPRGEDALEGRGPDPPGARGRRARGRRRRRRRRAARRLLARASRTASASRSCRRSSPASSTGTIVLDRGPERGTHVHLRIPVRPLGTSVL